MTDRRRPPKDVRVAVRLAELVDKDDPGAKALAKAVLAAAKGNRT